MKYLFFIFTLLLSLTAYTEITQKQKKDITTTAQEPPKAKPQEEPTAVDDLIRGELAAMKAYDVAMKNIDDEKIVEELKKIRHEHEFAASVLSKYVAAKPKFLEDTKEAGLGN